MVQVYGYDSRFKGTIKPTFPIITSLEMDNDGKMLYIGGKDLQPKGRLDVFDLEGAQLSTLSNSSKNACNFIMILTICWFFL